MCMICIYVCVCMCECMHVCMSVRACVCEKECVCMCVCLVCIDVCKRWVVSEKFKMGQYCYSVHGIVINIEIFYLQ